MDSFSTIVWAASSYYHKSISMREADTSQIPAMHFHIRIPKPNFGLIVVQFPRKMNWIDQAFMNKYADVVIISTSACSFRRFDLLLSVILSMWSHPSLFGPTITPHTWTVLSLTELIKLIDGFSGLAIRFLYNLWKWTEWSNICMTPFQMYGLMNVYCLQLPSIRNSPAKRNTVLMHSSSSYWITVVC